MERLVEGLERYVGGYSVLTSNMIAKQRSDGQTKDLEWVRDVDRAYNLGLSPISLPSTARFMLSSSDLSHVSSLIAQFKERMHDASLNPTSQIRQIQSPLYVGCSTELQKRIEGYSLRRKLTGINKPLRLPVSLKIKVAIRTWK